MSVPAAKPEMIVEAELRTQAVTARVVHFTVPGPGEHLLRHDECCWLDLCLSPRPANARACYRDRWTPQRFSRIGDIFLLPPGLTLQTRSDGGGRQGSVICMLHTKLLDDWLETSTGWTDCRLEASLDIDNQAIRSLIIRLAGEARHPGFGSEILAELIAGQMAIELGRHCNAAAESASPGGLASWRLRRIDERLKDGATPPSLAELARLCGLSVRQLTRGFRASRGISIGRYVEQSRAEQAKLLIASGASIKSVAYQMGFSSPSSFCCAFRRATAASPRQFAASIGRKPQAFPQKLEPAVVS